MSVETIEGRGARAFARPEGTAEQRWMGETTTFFLATGADTAGAFALVDEQAVHGETVPLHVHAEDVESFYVLDGEIDFYLGDRVVRAGAGAFAHVPGGVVHGFRIVSPRARYLILTTPRHGEFYGAISDPEPGVPIDGERIGRACEQYGIEFVGPFPD